VFANDIGLKAMVSEQRFRDFLAEAERARQMETALTVRPQRSRIAEARAGLATAFLRAGTWLMPDENTERDLCSCGLELRLGR
jgi:hypothetical protein